MRRARWLIGLLMLVVLAGVFAGSMLSASAPESALAFRPGPISPIAVMPRLVDIDGAPVHLGTDEVVLHFWATSCVPCRAELPRVLGWGREPGRAQLVCVAIDSSRDEVRDFFGGIVPPEIAFDVDHTLARTLGVASLPDTYLARPGPRGWRVVSRQLGVWPSASARP